MIKGFVKEGGVLIGYRETINWLNEYDFIKYFFIGTTVILWLLVIRLELTAKKKAESLYGVQMKEYEIMRTKWLEIASKKMEIEAGSDFDPEFHEAITQIPAPEESLKGKIVDVIEPGYLLNDKVIRYAKVVTGS